LIIISKAVGHSTCTTKKQSDIVYNKSLKVTATKSYYDAHKADYLGYWITRNGIHPITKKIQAVLALDIPKT
jgi:hypothetical protein